MLASKSRFVLAMAVVVVATSAAICGGGSASEDEIPLPDTKPFSADQETTIHEIRDAAMRIRGLNVTSEISEGTLTREEIRAYYDEVGSTITDEDRAEIETYNTALRMLRIIGPEDDLLDLFTGFWGDASAGFYALDEEKLVLIGDGSGLTYDDKSVLAHEYVHSFQDAAFDLDGWDKLLEKEEENEDGAPSEYGTTTSCLIEGDAELSQAIYEEQVLGPEPETPVEAVANPPAATQEPETPPGFLRYMTFNYNECALWALALYLDAGLKFDKLNEAYARPPATTEQVLHPEKFLQREAPTDMPPLDLRDRLGGDWERTESAIFGEFDVYNYLATVLEDEAIAGFAAAGWGVGWLGIYTDSGDNATTDDDRIITYVSLEFDTANDFDEFAGVYGGVIEKLGGASVTRAADGSAACWTGAIEHAYVGVNPSRKRVDIVMATDDESLKLAAAEPLSSGSLGKCPGWE
jgi:hypothetical protein